jgi:hypothetical protein
MTEPTDQLSPELDATIQTLTHEEALGVIRALAYGGWIHGDAIRLAIRVQKRATESCNSDSEVEKGKI